MHFTIIPLPSWKDDRGFVMHPLAGVSASSGDIRDFHTCSIRNGSIRGNHYHANGEEYIFFLGGRYRPATKDTATGKTEERFFRETGGMLARINRNIAHAIRNEGEAILYILCFYVSQDPVVIETIRHPVL